MTVSQAQSQYETAAAQIPQIESQIAQTENALSVLLGSNPGPIPRGKSIYDLALPAVPAGVPSAAARTPARPPAGRSSQLIAANAQIGAAKALYFPTISLTGALGSSSTDLSNLFKGATRVWNYAGQVIGPIFTFGAVSGQVAQSEAAQQAALLNYRVHDPECVCRCRQRAGGQPETEGTARRAGAPGRGAEGLRAPRQDCSTTAATPRTRRCCRPSSRCSRPSSRSPRCVRRYFRRPPIPTRRWVEAGSPWRTRSPRTRRPHLPASVQPTGHRCSSEQAARPRPGLAPVPPGFRIARH